MATWPPGGASFPLIGTDATWEYAVESDGAGSITMRVADRATGNFNGAVQLQSNPASTLTAGTITIASVGHLLQLVMAANDSAPQVCRVVVDGVNIVDIAANALGFHGAAPVAQAAHPVTLADVITLLTNKGLCAP